MTRVYAERPDALATVTALLNTEGVVMYASFEKTCIWELQRAVR